MATARFSDGTSFEVREGDTLLQSALRAGLGFPYECSVGACGSCKVELLQGDVSTLWDEAPGLTSRDRQRGRRLACQTLCHSDVTVKVRLSEEHVPSLTPQRHRARLASVRQVTSDLCEFHFKADGAARFQPGQYALLTLGKSALRRAYSMSNLPNDDGTWEFMIRRVPGGAATGELFTNVKPHDTVEIDGPYGLAGLRSPERDLVCIAGGSGLAPMLSIARAAAPLLGLNRRRLHFFYGGRTPSDLAVRPMLQELPGYGSILRYDEAVSQPDPARAWSGRTGFVHELVEERLSGALHEHEIYFAGPPPMVSALQDMLMRKHQVPYGQIHFDRFF
jgi:toluene monooxygenase electron transfer component